MRNSWSWRWRVHPKKVLHVRFSHEEDVAVHQTTICRYTSDHTISVNIRRDPDVWQQALNRWEFADRTSQSLVRHKVASRL
jgi:hypothetical protein